VKPAIVLFDLDGVLIGPRGYRAAVAGSVQQILDRMGLGAQPPTALVPALFESVGITSEWDMVPVTVAIVLNAVAQHTKQPLPPVSLPEVMEWVRAQRIAEIEIDYESPVRSLNGLVTTRITPAYALYQILLAGGLGHILPHLDNQPFVRDLLEDTRDPARSLTLRLVQSHVLGERVFRDTYGLEPEVQMESTLVAMDRPLLDARIGARLRELHAAGVLRMCAFTARPSLPPRDGGFSAQGYSPEAELALGLVNFDDIPLMGYGRLIAYGKVHGVSPDGILKPAPLQSLAAAAAAFTGLEWAALEWARQYLQDTAEGKQPVLAEGMPRAFDLHVFEDASVGIRGGQAAAELLRQSGAAVDYHPWGIATIADKEAALRAAGAPVFADVNQALRAAFGLLID